jgi:hypothetical protein
MLEELDVLRIVSQRLEGAGLPFMLTGSFAMAYYGKPRMTRDLDIVVSLREDDVADIVAALSPDFYIDADSVRAAVISQRLFNLMHLATSIKVDLIGMSRHCWTSRWTVPTSNIGPPGLA